MTTQTPTAPASEAEQSAMDRNAVCDTCGGKGFVALSRERLLAFIRAPGSSCPEHEMCAECGGTGSAGGNGCACGYASPICNKPFVQAPDVRAEWCWNQISGLPCGHDKACHTTNRADPGP